MGVLNTILDFVAAVAWPLVAITAIVVFVEPIRDRIRNMSRVSGPAGTGAEFFAAVAPAEFALEAIGQGSDEPPASVDDGTPVPPDLDGVPGDLVVMSRDELQTLVTEFAEAGWAIRGISAFDSPPKPVIGWTDEGQPHIEDWAVQLPPMSRRWRKATAPALNRLEWYADRDEESAQERATAARKAVEAARERGAPPEVVRKAVADLERAETVLRMARAQAMALRGAAKTNRAG